MANDEHGARADRGRESRGPLADAREAVDFGLRLSGLLAVAVLALWACLRAPQIDRFLRSALRTGGSLEVASVKLAVDLRPAAGADAGTGPVGEAMGVFRIRGPVDIERVHPERADGVEYIEIVATGEVDLRGGFIGDADELLALPDADGLLLRWGDRRRIYTYCGPPIPTALLLPKDRLSTWSNTCLSVLRALREDGALAMWPDMGAPQEGGKGTPTDVVLRALRSFEKQYFLGVFPPDDTDAVCITEPDSPSCDASAACRLLYAEMLYRKLHARGTGGEVPGAVPYPAPEVLSAAFRTPFACEGFRADSVAGSICRGLRSDLSEPPPMGFEAAAVGSWLDTLAAEGEARRCRGDIQNRDAVLSRCLNTSPVRGEGDAPVASGKADERHQSRVRNDGEGSATRRPNRMKEVFKNQRPVECIQGLPRFRGLYKNEPGEGDRIVVADRKKRVLVDLDYWWPEQ